MGLRHCGCLSLSVPNQMEDGHHCYFWFLCTAYHNGRVLLENHHRCKVHFKPSSANGIYLTTITKTIDVECALLHLHGKILSPQR